MENVILKSKHLDKFSDGLITALKQMGSVIGVNEIDLDEDSWYLKHTWTSEQENGFKLWLVDKLKTDKTFLKSLAKYPNLIKTNEQREKLANEFIMNYGWKSLIIKL